MRLTTKCNTKQLFDRLFQLGVFTFYLVQMFYLNHLLLVMGLEVRHRSELLQGEFSMLL